MEGKKGGGGGGRTMGVVEEMEGAKGVVTRGALAEGTEGAMVDCKNKANLDMLALIDLTTRSQIYLDSEMGSKTEFQGEEPMHGPAGFLKSGMWRYLGGGGDGGE